MQRIDVDRVIAETGIQRELCARTCEADVGTERRNNAIVQSSAADRWARGNNSRHGYCIADSRDVNGFRSTANRRPKRERASIHDEFIANRFRTGVRDRCRQQTIGESNRPLVPNRRIIITQHIGNRIDDGLVVCRSQQYQSITARSSITVQRVSITVLQVTVKSNALAQAVQTALSRRRLNDDHHIVSAVAVECK